MNLPNPIFDISLTEAAENQNYNQYYRPQFHYTPIQGLIGDATGLNYYDGTYYLFYMSDKWERQKNRHKRWVTLPARISCIGKSNHPFSILF